MSKRNPVHSRLGTEFVRKLSAEGSRIFTIEKGRQIAPSIGISDDYFLEMLHHLTQSGWLVRIRRGLYALSSTVPGTTPAHEFEIAMALVDPAAISYWSALNYHHLTDQTPRTVFVQTISGTSIPQNRQKESAKENYQVDGITYQFVRIKPERFFGTEKVWAGNAKITITDPERTLLDGLTMPQYCGDFGEVLHAFEVRGDNLDLGRIISYALKLDIVTAKRLGWVLENMGINFNQLKPLADQPIKGYRPLDPTGIRKGTCNNKWMIQENLPGVVS